MGVQTVDTLALLDEIGDRLRAIDLFEIVEFDSHKPTQFKKNYVTYSDGEGEYIRKNFNHVLKLPLIIEGAIFGENSARLGTRVLDGDLLRIFREPLGSNVVVSLESRNKETVSDGATSCKFFLELSLLITMPLFNSV